MSATDFRAPIKANQNPLVAALLDPRTADPTSYKAGQVWFRSDLNELRIGISTSAYITFRRADIALVDGDIAANAAIALSKLAVNPVARGNHTGTQTASTISDFDTQVRTNRADQLAPPTGPVAFNGQRATGLADPQSNQDAATKAYVDGIAQGLNVKGSVRVATVAAMNVSNPGGSTIDGVALTAGDRVLVKDQTTASQNGIYVFNGPATAMTRATDADSWAELVSAFTFVEQGTVNADVGYVSTADRGGTLNTTAVPWSQFSGAGTILGGAGLTKTGNSLDVGQGTGILVSADAVAVDTTLVARFAKVVITGTGAATTFNVDHNLGNTRPNVTVWEEATGAEIGVDVASVSGNRITVTFGLAPGNGLTFTVSVVG